MMTNRVRKYPGLVATVIAIAVVLSSCSTREDSLGSLRASEPTPELSPREVVEIQLLAFGNNGERDDGIEIAFRFASPANRAVTGPLDRFTNMMRGGVYAVMLDHDRAEYAETVVNGDRALQRVALYRESEVTVFDFMLRRQTDAPYVDCWMTEGVYLIGVGQAEQEQTI